VAVSPKFKAAEVYPILVKIASLTRSCLGLSLHALKSHPTGKHAKYRHKRTSFLNMSTIWLRPIRARNNYHAYAFCSALQA
jgi:hypothetical protein